MGVKERRIREREDVRRQIMDAARKLFARDGYDAVSMRRVAEQIEYSPTTIYLYFKDKAELLEKVCEESFAKLIEKLEAIRRTAKNPLDFARRGIRAYIDFGLDHPNHYQVTFMVSHREIAMDRYRDHMGQRAFDYLRRTVVECMNAGLIRKVDPELASQAVWAGTHGITSLLITHPNFPWVAREKLINGVIDMMFASLET
jgi:AcrR family transcriptional regulator